jgi:hypothetical protein
LSYLMCSMFEEYPRGYMYSWLGELIRQVQAKVTNLSVNSVDLVLEALL